ncbi:hypothetical protein M8J76_008600 [Diaphorina citri]|nr:hypothetical protein M8J75_007286 [Diaphorina citri]KAI5740252.1 hypothetical protein M8J76_002147 [Diaphorina citri]KAI5740933.1 hypothetical protein M8J76_008600 [Diaphorina citri]KAI5746729.1 hypothetical protein M8J77_006826 [Diaphorina citri]
MANYFLLLLLVVYFALTKETVLGDDDPSEIHLEGFDPNDPAHQKALKAFQNVLEGKSEPTLYESVKSNLASYAPNLRSLSSNLPTSYIPSLPSPSSYLPSSWSWTPTNYLPSWGTVTSYPPMSYFPSKYCPLRRFGWYGQSRGQDEDPALPN